MLNRRACLAGGVVALVAADASEACTLAIPRCETFEAGQRAVAALAVAQVAAVADRRTHRENGSETESGRVTATVVRRLKGGVRIGDRINFDAASWDCTGHILGFVPRAGDRLVLYLDGKRGAWAVTNYVPLEEYAVRALMCAP